MLLVSTNFSSCGLCTWLVNQFDWGKLHMFRCWVKFLVDTQTGGVHKNQLRICKDLFQHIRLQLAKEAIGITLHCH